VGTRWSSTRRSRPRCEASRQVDSGSRLRSPGREIDLELDPDVATARGRLLAGRRDPSRGSRRLVARSTRTSHLPEEFGRQGGPIVGSPVQVSGGRDRACSRSAPTRVLLFASDRAADRLPPMSRSGSRRSEHSPPEAPAVPHQGGDQEVPLFDDLPQDAFVAAGEPPGYHRHGAGHLIIREGEPGRSFFIIVRGGSASTRRGPTGRRSPRAPRRGRALRRDGHALAARPGPRTSSRREETEILE